LFFFNSKKIKLIETLKKYSNLNIENTIKKYFYSKSKLYTHKYTLKSPNTYATKERSYLSL